NDLTVQRFSANLPSFDGQHLADAIITARWTCGVRCNSAAALRALAQPRRMPTVRGFARAQPHFGGFAFRNSHVSRLAKQVLGKRQMGRRPLNRKSVEQLKRRKSKLL